MIKISVTIKMKFLRTDAVISVWLKSVGNAKVAPRILKTNATTSVVMALFFIETLRIIVTTITPATEMAVTRIVESRLATSAKVETRPRKMNAKKFEETG